MGIVIKDRVFETANEGLHNAKIARIEDLGLVEGNYGTKDKVRIVLEMVDQKDKEGKFVEVWMSATKSLHEKSTLGKFLNSLKINAKGEFDLNNIVGLKLQVVISHTEKEGRTYANVATVIPIRKAGTPAPAQTPPPVQEIPDEDIPF